MLRKATILIIEDEADLREMLAEMLEDRGYSVEEAANGRDGITRLRDGAPPNVVLMDIQMPFMNGDEVYAEMQADEALAKTPVVFMTSDPERAPAGVPLMKKPINVNKLIDVVKKLY